MINKYKSNVMLFSTTLILLNVSYNYSLPKTDTNNDNFPEKLQSQTTKKQKRRDEQYKVLINAAKEGDLETLRNLHADGVPLDLKSEKNYQAIHSAAYYGHLHIIKWLCESGDPQMIKHLYTNHDMPLDSENSVDGTHPLHWTSSNGRVAALNYFVGKVNLTEKDNKGKEPIHHAARYCRNDAVKILYKNGALLTAQDNQGNTSYDEAKTSNCYDLMGWISKEIQKGKIS